MAAQVLNSWKEIALYLGRGVRTVQRWEAELGLPVRRPRGKDRSAVIALPSEIDAWLSRAHRRAEQERDRSHLNFDQLHRSQVRLVAEATALQQNTRALQQRVQQLLVKRRDASASRDVARATRQAS